VYILRLIWGTRGEDRKEVGIVFITMFCRIAEQLGWKGMKGMLGLKNKTHTPHTHTPCPPPPFPQETRKRGCFIAGYSCSGVTPGLKYHKLYYIGILPLKKSNKKTPANRKHCP